MSTSVPVNQAQQARAFVLTVHHEPEGSIDSTKVSLKSPFVVLVAGGSRGIGKGIAIQYAKARASTIIITGRSSSSLDTAEEEIRTYNADVTIVKQSCDVTSQEQVAALAADIKQKIGRLDALIINAGTSEKTIIRPETGLRDFPWGLSKEVEYEDFYNVINLNVNAVWLMMHEFLPILEETKDGAQAIVAISSTASIMPDPAIMATSYSLSKFACNRIVEHCHLGHSRNGISVFALQPGGVKTDLSAAIPEGKGWEASKCWNSACLVLKQMTELFQC